jgi:signal transduction histidine kinase
MRLSIATKIFIAFACLIVVFTGVLMFGIYRTQNLFRQIERLDRRIVPVTLLLSDTQTDLKSFSVLLDERDPLVIQRTLQMTRLVHSLPDRIEQRVRRARSRLNSGALPDLSPRQTRDLADIRERMDSLESRTRDFADLARTFTDRALRRSSPRDSEEFAERIGALQRRLRRRTRRLDETITSLRTDLRGLTDRALDRANQNERSSLYALVGLSAFALLFAGGVLFVVVRTVRPLGELTEATKRIGEGDYRPIEALPEPWLGRDEITLLAEEFNAMAQKLAHRDEKLREQHEALLESERLATVGRMTSLITHELRNPLSSINLNADMLMEELIERGIDPDDPEVMPLLETIVDEVDHLHDITEEYLVYARLPSPELEVRDLTDVVHDLVDFHLGEWNRKGVSVAVDAPEEGLDVRVDPNHFRQALLNLVKNAIEASPEGASVEIALTRENDAGRIDIRDKGPGIPEDVRDDIFEPFFTTKSEGTGLGLAMTQQIVDEHDGTLDLSSTEGEGTTFSIRLPCVS